MGSEPIKVVSENSSSDAKDIETLNFDQSTKQI